MILAHLDWSTEAAPILRQQRLNELRPDARPLADSEREVLDRRPDVDPATSIGLRAWNAASSCRQIGFGIGPIPQTAIDDWCDRHLRDPIAADFLDGALRYVDNVILERASQPKG